MDRTLIICGSAGRGGVTEAMCTSAAAWIRGMGRDALVVYPSDMRIDHCTGCEMCSEGGCVIDDDMDRLYGLFADSDNLILATPLHFNGPSSLIKTVMDRFQTYWWGKGLSHPKRMALMVCAGSESPNFAPTVSIARAFALTIGMEWWGELCLSGTDRKGEEGVDGSVRSFVGDLFGDGSGAPGR